MKILEFFDIMSPQASFNIGGKDRVRTKIGGLFMILNVCTLLSYSAFSLTTFFQKVEPTVTESTMPSKGSPLSMRSYEMPKISVYAVKSDGAQDLNIERYASVYLELRERTGTKENKTKYPYYRCSQAIKNHPEWFENMRNFDDYKEYIAISSFCLKSPDIDFPVFNNFHSPQDAHVRVYIAPCALACSECATADEVKKAAFYLAYVRTKFDMNDYDSPMRKEYIELDQLTAEQSFTQSIKFSMKKVQLFDTLGLP